MKNAPVVRLFELRADLLEIRGDNPFRIRAYSPASQSLESLGEGIEAKVRSAQKGHSADARHLCDLGNIALGVAIARRAWIVPAQVVNTWPLEKLLDWTRRLRPARGRTTARRSR
jgi:Helix-hairpin-helix domain